MDSRPDVLVVGAGVIGLGIAWRCLQAGASVTVVDPHPGSGASWTAAGMLAPVTELHFGEEALLHLNLESAARYPAFVAQLSDRTGMDVGYRACATVVTAWDSGDLAALRDIASYASSWGLPAQMVSARDLRALEPALSPGLAGGLVAADDHQVDNRRLHAALLAAFTLDGGELVPVAVDSLHRQGDAVTGVVLADGTLRPAGQVVLAAGAWSGRLLPGLPVYPVKGQTLRLRTDQPVLSHVVRGAVRGSPVYAVPRADGQVVVGASSEEAGFDLRPRAGAVYELLRDVQTLVPELGEAHFEEVSTSVRPGTADNAPILGPSQCEGLVLATGHYRNGIVLTPVTADGIAQYAMTGRLPVELAPFTHARFAAEGVAW